MLASLGDYQGLAMLRYPPAVVGCPEAAPRTASDPTVFGTEAGAHVLCAVRGRRRTPAQSLARFPANMQLQACSYWATHHK